MTETLRCPGCDTFHNISYSDEQEKNRKINEWWDWHYRNCVKPKREFNDNRQRGMGQLSY
jgi:hypothetical protein